MKTLTPARWSLLEGTDTTLPGSGGGAVGGALGGLGAQAGLLRLNLGQLLLAGKDTTHHCTQVYTQL